METKNEELIDGFKNENIVGVIKYVGSKEEFLNFANDLAVKIYGTNIPTKEATTVHLYRTTCTMYILRTVNGILRNEIIFYKNEVDGK